MQKWFLNGIVSCFSRKLVRKPAGLPRKLEELSDSFCREI